MKAITKFTVAVLTVAALGAAAVHTIDAHALIPSISHRTDAADPANSKGYADWQGAFTQPFGSRVLTQGAPQNVIAGGTLGHGLTLQVFDGLDRMQTWHGQAQAKAM
jgi:hypothetical protein